MRHVISVLLQNEVGALTRMTGLFSTRGYNIETLNVAPTEDPLVSRVTLVVDASDAAIAQLNTQLAKLVDVVNIHDMTLGEHFELELVIVKMKLKADDFSDLKEHAYLLFSCSFFFSKYKIINNTYLQFIGNTL